MTTALPPGPPEIPQNLWDIAIGLLAFTLGWLVRHFRKK
jgi:hypothetical protein